MIKIQSYFFLYFVLVYSQIFAQVSEVEVYAFGNSLIDHRPPAIPTPSDETTILHWMYDIASFQNQTFTATGQYGFLPSHDNLPPQSNWGYDTLLSPWDSETQTFASSTVNTILVTAANFIQFKPPTAPHPIDGSTTVVQSTETIFNWTNTQKEGLRYYIYAHWPEMDLQEAFPPTLPQQSEIDFFHQQTMGGYTEWWMLYQDEMMDIQTLLQPRLIPVGSIISTLLTDSLFQDIPFDELYEDSAPHGRASLYFLAGAITYMAMYERQLPENYIPSNLVHPTIVSNIDYISAVIWQELNAFNFDNGDSRVFYSNVLDSQVFSISSDILVSPNPASSVINIQSPTGSSLEVSLMNALGITVTKLQNLKGTSTIAVSNIPEGIYFIKCVDQQTIKTYLKKVIISR